MRTSLHFEMQTETAKIEEVMTRTPVTCTPENTLEDCANLMQKHQVRRIPVVDNEGRCVGIVAQADIALHVPAEIVAKTLTELSKSLKMGSEARATV